MRDLYKHFQNVSGLIKPLAEEERRDLFSHFENVDGLRVEYDITEEEYLMIEQHQADLAAEELARRPEDDQARARVAISKSIARHSRRKWR